MINVPEFVARCVFFGRASAEDTSLFKEYNHDALCEAFLGQLETIASFCERDNVHPSVTQGPRDQGGDVLLRYENGRDSELLVFQVKSHNEFDSDLSKNLKAGFLDSIAHYTGMKRYYISLCGDSQTHFKRITAISTEFSTHPLARVVVPEYLTTFLSLDSVQIEAVYRRLTDAQQWTYETAAFQDAKRFEDDDNLFFAMACMLYYFENGSNSLPESFYLKDSRLTHRFDRTQIADLRAEHADGLLEIWTTKDDRLRTEMLRGIEAMYRSLIAERDWSADSAFAYMFSFLRKPPEIAN